jgi:hypothetical protein
MFPVSREGNDDANISVAENAHRQGFRRLRPAFSRMTALKMPILVLY